MIYYLHLLMHSSTTCTCGREDTDILFPMQAVDRSTAIQQLSQRSYAPTLPFLLNPADYYYRIGLETRNILRSLKEMHSNYQSRRNNIESTVGCAPKVEMRRSRTIWRVRVREIVKRGARGPHYRAIGSKSKVRYQHCWVWCAGGNGIWTFGYWQIAYNDRWFVKWWLTRQSAPHHRKLHTYDGQGEECPLCLCGSPLLFSS